jgi:MarR family 2-MHQ and catechol resistance regulon transcriptional repressor
MLTSGSMTAALDRLGRRGLVERKEDEVDRRVRVVRLTEAGTNLIREAFEAHKQAMEEAVADVEEADREVLIISLRRLGLGAMRRLADEDANKSVAAKSGRRRGTEE